MALDLTEEQKATGRTNFAAATGDLTRRSFMKSMTAAAVASAAVIPVSAAVYFGYKEWDPKSDKAVKCALIGCGDEGGVLLGEHNPEFNHFVALCDIRPDNQERIIKGQGADHPRKGYIRKYGEQAAKNVPMYEDYKKLIADKDKLGIEMVVIALPLFLHAPVAIDCMKAGLHVLCEKLMAGTIADCKAMIRSAKENNVILSIGHQRHYSMLYAHALEVVKADVLGEIKHIRALWHRNNTWPLEPGSDWATGVIQPTLKDSWCKPVTIDDKKGVPPAELQKHGYKSIEELIRWRLYNRTGGGLMAELGSHQLDASSIFLGKVHPLSVSGVGGRYFYGDLEKAENGLPTGPNPRECDDHVFPTFVFPGKNHPKGPNGGTDQDDKVIVTYSSINTNGFEQYGECLMGSRGTMIVEGEQDVYLYKEPGKGGEDSRSTTIAVTTTGSDTPALASAASGPGAPVAAVVKTGNPSGWGDVSRGYREEMEHFAYCVRRWDKKKGYEKNNEGKYVQEMPRCHGEVAMADAILALTSNMAMRDEIRIPFELEWFDSDNSAVPEDKYGKKSQA